MRLLVNLLKNRVTRVTEAPRSIQQRWKRLLTRYRQCYPKMVRSFYAPGYDSSKDVVSSELILEALETAKKAENVLLFVGLPNAFEAEGYDMDHMEIPLQHQQLINEVVKANSNTVVILSNGSPIVMPWCNQPGAIVEAYLGGQAGGAAIADILFGDVNPGGKLAETFPLSQNDIPADQNFPGHNRQVEYREGLYVGYRYFDTAKKNVQNPFGHGLSYTSFEYHDLNLSSSQIKADENLNVYIKSN